MPVSDCNIIGEWFIATINKANGGPFAAAKKKSGPRALFSRQADKVMTCDSFVRFSGLMA